MFFCQPQQPVSLHGSFAYVLALEKAACKLLNLFAFREERATRAKEVRTRATNQRGRATTEASDQGLRVGFIDVGLQQLKSTALGSQAKTKSQTRFIKCHPFGRRSCSFIAVHPQILLVYISFRAILLCLSLTVRDMYILLHSRGPPRPRPVRDGEEDKENQVAEDGQNQQPRQRRYRRNFNYRRRRPQSDGKPGQETKEAKTGGDPPAEKTSAPEAQQGGAE